MQFVIEGFSVSLTSSRAVPSRLRPSRAPLIRQIGLLAIDVRSPPEAQSEVLASVRNGRPMMVAFANAHSVNLASTSTPLRRAMNEALLLNDGVGLDIASKLLFGAPFPANLNGTDFVPACLAASQTPVRLFLVGGKSGVAQSAGRAIEKASPNVEVVGTLSGYFSADEEEDQLFQIKQSGANMVLVGLGQPIQELWAQRNWRKISGPCICVGGLFDFLTLKVPRAPHVIRRLRLEWAFRLAMEPRRLANRYLVGNAKFLMSVIRQKVNDAPAGHRLGFDEIGSSSGKTIAARRVKNAEHYSPACLVPAIGTRRAAEIIKHFPQSREAFGFSTWRPSSTRHKEDSSSEGLGLQFMSTTLLTCLASALGERGLKLDFESSLGLKRRPVPRLLTGTSQQPPSKYQAPVAQGSVQPMMTVVRHCRETGANPQTAGRTRVAKDKQPVCRC